MSKEQDGLSVINEVLEECQAYFMRMGELEQRYLDDDELDLMNKIMDALVITEAAMAVKDSECEHVWLFNPHESTVPPPDTPCDRCGTKYGEVNDG